MIVIHKTYLPSFGLLARDQDPVCEYTVLSVNESVRDCAAYRGIGPVMNGASESEQEALHERIRAEGQKISEQEACSLFDEIDGMHLCYRR